MKYKAALVLALVAEPLAVEAQPAVRGIDAPADAVGVPEFAYTPDISTSAPSRRFARPAT
jgi:hypothetical protein